MFLFIICMSICHDYITCLKVLIFVFAWIWLVNKHVQRISNFFRWIDVRTRKEKKKKIGVVYKTYMCCFYSSLINQLHTHSYRLVDRTIDVLLFYVFDQFFFSWFYGWMIQFKTKKTASRISNFLHVLRWHLIGMS